ncbi:sensor histidine kinase [Microbispora sp. CA-135349]|uniref:sensor histidine kinase n=1 Tax=Microbispora sp. CA-135349 TaxID=3239953 RepID=UPI003D8A76A6
MEFSLVTIGVGIRAFDLIQSLISVLTGSIGESTSPLLDGGLLTLVSLESLGLGLWLIKRRSVLPFAWPYVVDFLLSLAALASAALYIAPQQRLMVWTMWAFPVTLSTAVIVGGVCRRWRSVLISSGALAATYLAVTALPLTGNRSDLATALANSVAYPGFATVAFFFTRFVRRLAKSADDARLRIAELESERSRAIVHDLLPYLKLDDPATADERARPDIAGQRRAKYEQMRSYVDGNLGPTNIEALVRRVVGIHQVLSARIAMDIGEPVELPEDVAERLERALDTALANVEQHAMGAHVVVSAATDPHRLTVRVLDDGPGFSAPLHRPGFGMTEILGRHLAAVGGRASVHSIPGRGTAVEIVVPR